MRWIIIGLATALIALPAAAQSDDDNRARCSSSEPDTRIAACTALIQSGRETTANLVLIYVNRGVAYNRKGLYDLAIADANAALRLRPDFGNAYGVAGTAYRHKGFTNLAIGDYTLGISNHPDPIPLSVLYSDRGGIYESRGQYDLAIADYSSAIALRPDYANYYAYRAHAYHRRGQDALGLPDAERAVALAPNDADHLETRAEIYEGLGRRDQAVAEYQAVLRLDPAMKEARAGLQRLGVAP